MILQIITFLLCYIVLVEYNDLGTTEHLSEQPSSFRVCLTNMRFTVVLTMVNLNTVITIRFTDIQSKLG